MAHSDDPSKNERQRRQMSRRAFLAGGAVVGGTVLWGGAAADEASAGIIRGPIIPYNRGTGSVGTGATGPQGFKPPVIGGGGGGGAFTVDTAFAQPGASGAPLFAFRFR